jgi:hypothetical protein
MVNLEDSNPELNDLSIPNQTQGVVELGDILSLLRLPTRKRQQKAINGLFQFTCGHIKPIPSNVEIKGIRKKNC